MSAPRSRWRAQALARRSAAAASRAARVDLAGPMAFERGLQFAAGADAGKAEGGDGDGHGEPPPMLRRGRQRGCANVRTDARPQRRTCDRPDTPPGDVMCRGRSPGSRVNAAVRPSQGRNPSDSDGQRLAAYSCGGSAGFTPASLLAPRQSTTRRTSTATMGVMNAALSRDI